MLVLLLLFFLLFLYGLIAASGDYNKRCEDEEYRKRLDYERRKQEQRERMEQQNRIPEQKRDDSSWF